MRNETLNRDLTLCLLRHRLGGMADTSIPAELRATLAREQRSQRWLAEKSGISPAALSRKMRGDTSFTLDELLSVTHALGVSAADLIATIESQPSAA